MATDKDRVAALQQAILERAQQLADEHVQQGKMTRDKILESARDKIKILEKKELLTAKIQADREYQRKVQASELQMQAEQDRNRWGLVQSVLDTVIQQINEIHQDKKPYEKMFRSLLKQSVEKMGCGSLIAHLSNEDVKRYSEHWDTLIKECCGEDVKITLSDEVCDCSGGFKLISEAGDVMLDNTFEGLFQRKDGDLQRLIYERLFSSVKGLGGIFNG